MSTTADDEIVSKLSKSKMIFTFPLNSVSLENIKKLRSILDKNAYATIISRKGFAGLVDGTPFCQIVPELTSSNFCVLIGEESKKTYEQILKWIKQIRNELDNNDNDNSDSNNNNNSYSHDGTNFVICKKGHLIKIQ